jgi:hypothetical protein
MGRDAEELFDLYRWGTIYRAPTGIIVNQNDPMHMVWHDHEGIHLRVREMSRNFVPAGLYDPSQRVDSHQAFDHLSKQTFPPEGNHADKIPACLGIIVPFQPDGMPASLLW